jgi:hypothetical protein
METASVKERTVPINKFRILFLMEAFSQRHFRFDNVQHPS